ncbi:hypothetical protein CERSUDRAFT_73914 [Gelatoporia subvermispora B]|uniref:Uncharacterized protein n=1 Tax=Ceriporiopsis subvermispora (strain B) TaxID=914234 RepID=M2QXN8_CERS8|nr:hypothetical protein CERSUDRAFT_73914 [Gelatoporia subvermispora B]
MFSESGALFFKRKNDFCKLPYRRQIDHSAYGNICSKGHTHLSVPREDRPALLYHLFGSPDKQERTVNEAPPSLPTSTPSIQLNCTALSAPRTSYYLLSAPCSGHTYHLPRPNLILPPLLATATPRLYEVWSVTFSSPRFYVVLTIPPRLAAQQKGPPRPHPQGASAPRLCPEPLNGSAEMGDRAGMGGHRGAVGPPRRESRAVSRWLFPGSTLLPPTTASRSWGGLGNVIARHKGMLIQKMKAWIDPTVRCPVPESVAPSDMQPVASTYSEDTAYNGGPPPFEPSSTLRLSPTSPSQTLPAQSDNSNDVVGRQFDTRVGVPDVSHAQAVLGSPAPLRPSRDEAPQLFKENTYMEYIRWMSLGPTLYPGTKLNEPASATDGNNHNDLPNILPGILRQQSLVLELDDSLNVLAAYRDSDAGPRTATIIDV